MRAVDTPGDPLFHQEPFQISGVALKVYGGCFDDYRGVCFLIHSQINVTAAAGVHLADDFVAVENRPRFQYRRKRQLG